ncbi:MAG: hypothetical protein Aurels2KO_52770 [Aureliella sp.]
MESDRRQENRAPADRKAVLIRDDNTVMPVCVSDVSVNGVGITTDLDPCLTIGEIAKVKIREHTISGEVVRLQPVDKGVKIGLRLSTADGLLLA